MLVIRLKRTGRTGHAQFRLVAQDKRFSPASGRVVAYLGSYNPHTKDINFDKEKIASYLSHGAQPSPRVIKLLEKESVELPKWVRQPAAKKRTIKNPEKLRRNRPAETETKPATEKLAEPEPATVAEDAAPIAATKSDTKADNEAGEQTNETSAEAPTANKPEEKPAGDTSEPDIAAEAKPEAEPTSEKKPKAGA